MKTNNCIEAKIVSIEELTKDNPMLCLSPLRVFGLCSRCEIFKRKLYKNNYDVEKTISSLRCKPILRDKEKIKKLLKKKAKVLKELKKINKKLEKYGLHGL